jgi:hypothetical protein
MKYYRLRVGTGTRATKAESKDEAVTKILGTSRWVWENGYAVSDGNPGHRTTFIVEEIKEEELTEYERKKLFQKSPSAWN